MVELGLVLQVVVLRQKIEDLHEEFINVFKAYSKFDWFVLQKHIFVCIENFHFFRRINLVDLFRSQI